MSEIKAALKTRRSLTENCSATYSNSGYPCIDFFFQVVPNTPPTACTTSSALREPTTHSSRPSWPAIFASSVASATAPRQRARNGSLYNLLSIRDAVLRILLPYALTVTRGPLS